MLLWNFELPSLGSPHCDVLLWSFSGTARLLQTEHYVLFNRSSSNKDSHPTFGSIVIKYTELGKKHPPINQNSLPRHIIRVLASEKPTNKASHIIWYPRPAQCNSLAVQLQTLPLLAPRAVPLSHPPHPTFQSPQSPEHKR